MKLKGVYGMWNIYAGALMIFYAPSHKNKPNDRIYYGNIDKISNLNEQKETINWFCLLILPRGECKQRDAWIRQFD